MLLQPQVFSRGSFVLMMEQGLWQVGEGDIHAQMDFMIHNAQIMAPICIECFIIHFDKFCFLNKKKSI